MRAAGVAARNRIVGSAPGTRPVTPRGSTGDGGSIMWRMKLTAPIHVAWACTACSMAAVAATPVLRDSTPSMGWAYEAKATDRAITIDVRKFQFRVTESGTGAMIETTGAVAWPGFGLPRVPSLVLLFEAPAEGDYDVRWSETAVEERPLQPLAPVATPVVHSVGDEVSRTAMRPFRDLTVYGRDAYWPDTVVRHERARGAGRRFLRVEIFPIQYNPVRGRLRVHRDLHVVLSKREPASNE